MRHMKRTKRRSKPLFSTSPTAEHEIVRLKQSVRRQEEQRQGVKPPHTGQIPPRNEPDHGSRDGNHPDPAEDAHVAVLVGLVGLGVPRHGPGGVDAEEAVLDGAQVRVGLDRHDLLHVVAVPGLGPQGDDDEAVDEGGQGEGNVPHLDPFGAQGEEENARDGVGKDVECRCQVEEETYKEANLLVNSSNIRALETA